MNYVPIAEMPEQEPAAPEKEQISGAPAFLPDPQKRGIGGTLNLMMRDMRPGPPARIYWLVFGCVASAVTSFSAWSACWACC